MLNESGPGKRDQIAKSTCNVFPRNINKGSSVYELRYIQTVPKPSVPSTPKNICDLPSSLGNNYGFPSVEECVPKAGTLFASL